MTKVLILTITIICVAGSIVALLSGIFNKVLNIYTYLRASRLTDTSERVQGIIYNPKTKKLEADQSILKPF